MAMATFSLYFIHSQENSVITLNELPLRHPPDLRNREGKVKRTLVWFRGGVPFYLDALQLLVVACIKLLLFYTVDYLAIFVYSID
jgi:hypothetical protein